MLHTFVHVAFTALFLSDITHADSSHASVTSSATAESYSSVNIPQNNEQHHPICGPNEVIDDCVNGGCAMSNCTQLAKGKICIHLISGGCKTGCKCKENYLRDNKGVCIPITRCPTPECPKHEVFDFCPAPPKECAVDERLVLRQKPPKLGDKDCNPSCRCKDDLYRNYNGLCVPKENCMKCTGPNEYYSCGGACDNECDTITKQNQTNCPIINIKCNEKCYCKSGYARNVDNQCIPISECPQCKENEKYVKNVNEECKANTCRSLNTPLDCVQENHDNSGNPGCVCVEGYVRNDNGICVPINECRNNDPECGPNEVIDGCVNGGCGIWNCSQLGTGGLCIDLIAGACKTGCKCKENYLRNDEGFCIPITECPIPECIKDEVFDFCPAPPKDCAIDERLVLRKKPPKLGDVDCSPSCRCKDDLYRNYNGLCVPKKDCTKCEKNENYVKNVNEECKYNTCRQLGLPLDCFQANYDNSGSPGCVCVEGYVRNDNGTCVTIEECPNNDPICGLNEVIDSCINNGCMIWNCSQLSSADLCINQQPYACKIGCKCKENYLRNDEGICIPIYDCPIPDCRQGEVFDFCPSPLKENLIIKKSALRQKLPNLGDIDCRPTCRCTENYHRDNNGLCVPNENLTKCYGKNEIYDICPNTCYPQICSNIWTRYKKCEPKLAVCTPSCRCKPGFYRNVLNECISTEECMKCTGRHEYYSCGGACDNECNTITQQNQTNCPIINKKCNEKCYCEKGYARNADKECIPISECPPPQCNENEKYVSNINGDCKVQKCSDLGNPLDCYKDNYDNSGGPGCTCIDGYARNNDGICIPVDDCPPKCNENEKYVNNVNEECKPQKCSELGNYLDCYQKYYDNSGGPGCTCIDGYVRNEDGVCIPEENCPKCYGKNEIYEICPDTCHPQVCSSIWTRYKKCGPKLAVCTPSCRCKPGFYRNVLNDCISTEDCMKCTGRHEYYSCGGACDNECDKITKQNQTNCPIINIKCNEKCYCESGYARNADNECIPISECPPPQCKENEKYVSNVNKDCKPQKCSEVDNVLDCYEKIYDNSGGPGCTCIDGYARNEEGVCIPVENCPPRCKANEEYVNNTKSVCRVKLCSELGFSLNCEQLHFNSSRGKPGCICKDGFAKDKHGSCIPVKHCPSCGGDSNATTGCGTFCKSCTTYKNGSGICHALCRYNGCECKKRYVYNRSIKKCVLPEDC